MQAKTLIPNSVPVVCFPSDCSHSSDYERVVNSFGILNTTEETILDILKKHIDC